jgi:hypothetical protein
MIIANMRRLSGQDVIEHGDFFCIGNNPFLYACVLSVGTTVEDVIGDNPEFEDIFKFYRPIQEAGE